MQFERVVFWLNKELVTIQEIIQSFEEVDGVFVLVLLFRLL